MHQSSLNLRRSLKCLAWAFSCISSQKWLEREREIEREVVCECVVHCFVHLCGIEQEKEYDIDGVCVRVLECVCTSRWERIKEWEIETERKKSERLRERERERERGEPHRWRPICNGGKRGDISDVKGMKSLRRCAWAHVCACVCVWVRAFEENRPRECACERTHVFV